MNEQTREALEKSIAIWKQRAQGKEIPCIAANCDLCQLFNDRPYGCDDECPVKQATRLDYCQKTPYKKYADYIDDYPAKDEKAMELAQDEVDFLESLMPTTIMNESKQMWALIETNTKILIIGPTTRIDHWLPEIDQQLIEIHSHRSYSGAKENAKHLSELMTKPRQIIEWAGRRLERTIVTD